jgi:hypothetical protein
MASVLALSVVDHGFEPWSRQTKGYEIGICCFSAKHVAIRWKSKDWSDRQWIFSASSLKQQSADRHVAPTQTHYPNSEPTSLCSFTLMSIRGLLFQWTSTKNPLSVCVAFNVLEQYILLSYFPYTDFIMHLWYDSSTIPRILHGAAITRVISLSFIHDCD